MRKLLFVVVLAAASPAIAAAGAPRHDPPQSSLLATLLAGDAKRGESLAETCVACHGPTGVSPADAFPNLAGQGAPYLLDQMQRIRDGGREVPTMAGQLDGMTDADLRDIAAWYDRQAPGGGGADPALVETGRDLYLAGDAARGIPACTACHGPTGQGLKMARIPHLAGQKTSYTAAMLRAFRGEQGGPPNQVMMQQVSRNLHDDDIAALASYLSGLYALPTAAAP